MKFVTLLLTSVLFFSTAFAAPQNKGPVVLNPTSLRSLLMERNIDLAMAMNQVQQAKDRRASRRRKIVEFVQDENSHDRKSILHPATRSRERPAADTTLLGVFHPNPAHFIPLVG